MALEQRGRELWAEFDDPDDAGQTGVRRGSDPRLTAGGQTGSDPVA